MRVQPGEMLSHYRLVEKIGEGGMGVVWRALDTKLDREVAIKILPEELASDPERLGRFEREAKAVAALNHPNIVTLYSVEEAARTRFITMELVRGMSLTERIPRNGLPLGKFFDLSVALADAISAAHQQGITHRDLKPDNVMIGDDGRLKVLDFGLAKLREEARTVEGSQMPTATVTQEGKILGTVSYMSPEQAEGKAIDHRSDIFSVGVMLYQMATGQRPFAGDTSVSIISSIIKDTPASITELNQALPRHLGRIVKRCLAKDPARRFQTALDLRNELEELKEELDSGELLATGTTATGPRRGRWSVVVAAIVGAAAVLAALLGYQAMRRGEATGETASGARDVSFQRLTEAPGSEAQPNLSPDGKWFVYWSDASGDGDIYLHAVGGANPINLTPASPDRDAQPAFSPDGERIAFRSEREGGGIFVMGRTGESIRRITEAGYFPAWSPDGTEIAYATVDFDYPNLRTGISELWTVELATGEARRISEGDAVQPHWSPSGQRIAYWGVRRGSGRRDIWTVAASGGPPVPVTDDPYLDWNPLWSPDGRHLYFASDRGGSMNLWRVPIDEEKGRTTGPFEPVTTPAQELGSIAIAAAGEQIAYTAVTWRSNLQRMAFDPTRGAVVGTPTWITRGANTIAVPSVSPDGEWIAYNYWAEQEDIVVVRVDGSGRRRLTNDLHRDRAPRWSPDGTEIAFFSDRSGSYEIWTIRPDGSGLRQLTDTPGLSTRAPDWSPDGSSMICHIDDVPHLFDPSEGWDRQTPVPLPQPGEDGASAVSMHWSPDGRWLGGQLSRQEGGIVLYSVEREEYRELTEHGYWPVWGRDGRGLFFSTESNAVYLVDIETGSTREVLPASETITYYVAGLSPGSDEIYVLRIESESDIWLVTLP